MAPQMGLDKTTSKRNNCKIHWTNAQKTIKPPYKLNDFAIFMCS